MATEKQSPTEEALEYASAFQDKSNRYPTDERLRRAGFNLHSRKRGQPVMWMKDGKIVSQEHALLIADSKERGK